ncbi:hypothetical protein ACKUB1_08070 [Methanospirillum stamsii]|uniref:Tetratricopeptide repeat protein n=1 Tax=Methanospirillum stamsii TaxID=1277351 RepID=A0A2V2NGY1_9EURY|nr:hypothetical protein [Methanospirillum stamsii]PWR75657.1 hypothetical protein DLD82_03480 [Methanospirillum stamsii]
MGIMAILLIGTFSCSASSDPTVMPIQLQPDASAPYEDEDFLLVVTPVINGLSDTQLNISERMDATSAYYSAAAMKVSPEFYPIGLNITRLLFYLGSSSEALEELDKSSGLGTHNSEVKDTLKAQAKADLEVAEEAWRGLTMIYPNSTLFG